MGIQVSVRQTSQAHHLRTDLISIDLAHLGFGAGLSVGKVFDAFLALLTLLELKSFLTACILWEHPFLPGLVSPVFSATFCVGKLMTASPCPGLSAPRDVMVRTLTCEGASDLSLKLTLPAR